MAEGACWWVEWTQAPMRDAIMGWMLNVAMGFQASP
jgi:hypothetical protein